MRLVSRVSLFLFGLVDAQCEQHVGGVADEVRLRERCGPYAAVVARGDLGVMVIGRMVIGRMVIGRMVIGRMGIQRMLTILQEG